MTCRRGKLGRVLEVPKSSEGDEPERAEATRPPASPWRPFRPERDGLTLGVGSDDLPDQRIITRADGVSLIEVRPGVLATLLGPPFSAAEMWGGQAPGEQLYPEEERLVAQAGAKRRLEFTRGRVCARHAMEYLGIPSGPLLSRADRSPAWPDGLIGSITHTENFCGAVVARVADARGVGIDAENATGVGANLWRIVFTPEEQDCLRGLPTPERERLAAIMFSAKEAFYKAQFPLTGAWLDFLDVAVAPTAEGVQIKTLTDRAGAPIEADGAVWAGQGLVITAVVLPWPGRSGAR